MQQRAIFFVLITTIIIFGGAYLYIQQQRTQKVVTTKGDIPKPTKPPVLATITTTPDAIPASWERYTSSEYGFTISFPPDVTHDTTTEGERFYKLGKSQSQGTELYDGIRIVIKSGSLGKKPFAEWVNQTYENTKNDPVQPRMGEKKPITLAGKQGITYTVSSLGDATMIYLPKGTDEYLEITNGTVEPADSTQGLQKTAALILSSLRYTQ